VTELLVGTRRGLFVFQSDGTSRGPFLAGREVYHAIFDARTGSYWAATDHAVWGAHLHTSKDGENWEVLEQAPHFHDERGLKAIWFIAPGPDDSMLAGIEPAGLFVSRGADWQPITTLNDHPTRKQWQPAGGGLALHSIIVDRSTWFCAISAGGTYRSDDGGVSWSPKNKNVRADFQPERYPDAGQCVHKMLMIDGRLYQVNHCGVYRSDDRGDNWTEITEGLPSEFGYALAVLDRDTLLVIPEASSDMRATPEGKLRVYRSNDAGITWLALTEGLPQENAYISVLREGMCAIGDEVYFGTSSGHLFASSNRGERWTMLAGFLPRILSVTIGRIDPGLD
jgi:photosystem II stability/assembly factor-like uncharacterized protein